MNDIHAYSIRTYEKQISHDYYGQIVAHEICDACNWGFHVWRQKESNNNLCDMCMNYIGRIPLHGEKLFTKMIEGKSKHVQCE
jgi:hypothetical protein